MSLPSIPEVVPGIIRNIPEFLAVLAENNIGTVRVHVETGQSVGVAQGPGTGEIADLTVRQAELSRQSGCFLFQPRRCKIPPARQEDRGMLVFFIDTFNPDDVTVEYFDK